MADVEEPDRRTLGILSLVGACFLGAVLIVATIGKVADPVLFVEQIRKEGLEGILSANTIALSALALEMGLGVALILGLRSLWVLIPTTGLVMFFIGLTGRTYWWVITGQIEDSVDCGCFGVFLQRTATEAFWQDLLLLVPALVLAFLSRKALFAAMAAWKVAIAILSAVLIVGYTVVIVELPPPLAPVAEADVNQENFFQPTQQFRVLVDGVEDQGAEVLESVASLRFMVRFSGEARLALLDVRTSGVAAIPVDSVKAVNDDGSQLEEGVSEGNRTGFEVNAEGLSFEFSNRKIQLVAR